jgi:hypothetical protein
MTLLCTIEYGSRNTERRCGRAAVAGCAHCEASICSSCARECCGQVLCGYCYDYHLIHSCLKSCAPTEFRPVQVAFRPLRPITMRCRHFFHRLACARIRSAAFFVALRGKIPKCGFRRPEGALRCDRSIDYAAPVRSEFTEIFQALSSHSGT